MNTHSLSPLLQRFFTDRLLQQLGASPHTIASYRDTFRLLLYLRTLTKYAVDLTTAPEQWLPWSYQDAAAALEAGSDNP